MALPSGDTLADNSTKVTARQLLDQAVYLERTKLLFSNIPSTIIATFIVAPCLMFVNWNTHDRTTMITWFSYISLTMAYRLGIYLLFTKKKDNEINPQTWVNLFLLGTALTGIGWGVTGTSILLSDSIPQQMFTATMLAGISAGALATLTPLYSAIVIFTLLNMSPLFITMITFGTGIHYATAVMVLSFTIFIIGASSRMAKTIHDSISLRFQHDDALKNIADKKQHTDTLNISLQQQINEREKAEKHLESSMSQLKATLESATDGILVIDNNEQITNYNKSFIDLFSIPDTLIELENFSQIESHINCLLKDKPHVMPQHNAGDTLLLELNDDRLIEVYSRPQKIGNQTIGCVFSYRDVTIRMKSETSLQQAKAKAESANKEKSEFLSRISHELRTPLNAILGFGQLLNEDINHHLDSDEKNYTAHICTAGEHLLKLIDDLLDISRIESGKLNISLTCIPSDAVIEESIALVAALAEKNQIKLIVNKDAARHSFILADHTRCKQALVNLLSNAIKYNQKDGSVTLTVSANNSRVRFEIKDTGIGIPAESLKDIFQPFTRLKQFDKTQGTGIGLTITKRLIDVMNGSLNVSSEQGKGSTFWFELPQTSAPESNISTAQTTEKEFINKTMQKTHTILYIEDEPLNQALVKSIIKKIPNTVLLTADTGEEGIEIALSTQPDIILMDINLPGISGYDALKIIKSEKSFSSTPVFALSANAMPDEIQKGKEAGFFDYLVKPINIESTQFVLTNTLLLLESK